MSLSADREYYLNHVGYKDENLMISAINIKRYYLNHVGYKGRSNTYRNISIISII